MAKSVDNGVVSTVLNEPPIRKPTAELKHKFKPMVRNLKFYHWPLAVYLSICYIFGMNKVFKKTAKYYHLH